MASSVEEAGREEVVSVELPAPPGWKKKVFSLSLCVSFLRVYFALLYVEFFAGFQFLKFWLIRALIFVFMLKFDVGLVYFGKFVGFCGNIWCCGDGKLVRVCGCFINLW